MPTNYGDDSSLESYIDCFSKQHIMMIESDAIDSLIVEDFNCSPGSRLFPDLMKFANENNLLTRPTDSGGLSIRLTIGCSLRARDFRGRPLAP
jgi:hypothetical protein